MFVGEFSSRGSFQMPLRVVRN